MTKSEDLDLDLHQQQPDDLNKNLGLDARIEKYHRLAESQAELAGMLTDEFRVSLVTEGIKQADPQNIQQVYGTQIDLINSYYSVALTQSNRSFTWALRAAIAGLLFFVAAIIFLLLQQPELLSKR